MDRKTWRAAVHGVAKSQTQPSDWTELNDVIVKMRPFPLGLPGKLLWKTQLVRTEKSMGQKTKDKKFGYPWRYCSFLMKYYGLRKKFG